MSELLRIPQHRALHRPALVLGGERELVIFTGLLTFGTVAVSLNLVALIVCTLTWFVAVYAFRQMAKQDPQMSKVFIRHAKQARFYAARSTHWSEH